MNFCPSCGASLNNNSKFCASCGQNLISSSSSNISTNNHFDTNDEEEEENLLAPLPPKKRIPVWVFIIGAIFLIGGIGFIYRTITYPKNEMQVENLLCEKYWKESDVSVEAIYYDGKLIRKGKNIAATLENAFNGMDGDAVYKKFETDLNAMWGYDNYLFYKKINGGSYWQYGQWMDSKNLKDYVFGTDNYEMQKIDGHFVLQNSSKMAYNYYVETGELYDSFTIDEDKSEILALSKNELSVRNTLVMGKLKLVTNITYKVSSEFSHDTKQLKSYVSLMELGNGFLPNSNDATTPSSNSDINSAALDTAGFAPVDSVAVN